MRGGGRSCWCRRGVRRESQAAEEEEQDKEYSGTEEGDYYERGTSSHNPESLKRVYLLNARKITTSIIMIMIAIMIFSQGIPSHVLPLFSGRDMVR